MDRSYSVQRREARVRKILGNLDDRLNKISGSQVVNSKPIANITTTLPVTTHAKLSNECFFEKQEARVVEEETVRPFISPLPDKEPKSAIKSLASEHIVHVILVAVATYAILRFHAGYLICESAMVPFYTLVIGKLTIGSRKTAPNSLTFSLLTMFAASNKITSTILELFSVAANCSRDLCLYLFIIIFASAIFGV